jgi:hypothetical protein
LRIRQIHLKATVLHHTPAENLLNESADNAGKAGQKQIRRYERGKLIYRWQGYWILHTICNLYKSARISWQETIFRWLLNAAL